MTYLKINYNHREDIDMNKYKVITTCECISEYILYADSKEDAEEMAMQGEFDSCNETDYHDEEVIEVKEVT